MLAAVPLALAEGGNNIISIDASLVVVLILFLIFVFLLNRILFKPLGRVLDERESLTEGSMTQARAATGQYQARLADYEAAIRQARAESYRTLEQRREAALQERQAVLDEARRNATAEIERAKSNIAAEADLARKTLVVESRKIAEQIMRTVLGRAVGG